MEALRLDRFPVRRNQFIGADALLVIHGAAQTDGYDNPAAVRRLHFSRYSFSTMALLRSSSLAA